jgi:hypothetical protein
MQIPNPLYLVISRKAKGDILDRSRVFFRKLKDAKAQATVNNARKVLGADDWRPEKYNKGD